MNQKNPFSDYPGGDRIRPLESLQIQDKLCFVRVDFNVPIKDGKVTDDTRIRAALPTLNYMRDRKAKLIIGSHLGRPKGVVNPEFSMEPVAERLGEILEADVVFADDSIGDAIRTQARELRPGQVLVLENLRFHAGEEKNDAAYAHKLKDLCEVYVNDAFGTCHRAHASTAGLPSLMKEKAAGFLLEKEIKALSALVHNPKRPLVAVLGGSKVSDKIKVIEALMVKASKILIGGAMAYTFLRALNVHVGKSRVEVDLIPHCKKLLDRAKEKNCEIVLPLDHRVATSFENPGEGSITVNAHIMDEREMGLDIGPKTMELFRSKLSGAQSVFWNGPLGVFEKTPFNAGTFAMARAIAELPAQLKIVGGGDSVAAVNASDLSAGFTHISTGGGASLEFIEGAAMPGIEALKVNK